MIFRSAKMCPARAESSTSALGVVMHYSLVVFGPRFRDRDEVGGHVCKQTTIFVVLHRHLRYNAIPSL